MKFIKHGLIVLLLLVISVSYFSDAFTGKILLQGDIINWKGTAQEIVEHREKYDEEPLWTNSLFCGMPANMISMKTDGNLFQYIANPIRKMNTFGGFIFWAMLGFYLLLLAYNVNYLLAAAGAIAFAMCSYNFQIIAAGHNTKMVAIAMGGYMLAAMVYALRHRRWLGSVFFGIAVSLEVLAGHPQMTYYIGFLMVALLFSEFYTAYKNKALPAFMKTFAVLFVGGLLGLCTNLDSLYPNFEYSKVTMRGGSELNDKAQNTSGLQINYATGWSYGKMESFNLLIPNFKGGSSNQSLSTNSHIYKTLIENRIPKSQADRFIKNNLPTYWGEQPFTSGPAYIGAISIFLFVLGMFILKNRPLKWSVFAVSILILMLSWGNNFMWLTELFFYHFPMYNKFRTVASILIVLQFSIPLLGILVLKDIFSEGELKTSDVWKGLKISLCIVAGFTLLSALFPSVAGNFEGQQDSALPEGLIDALRDDRRDLLSNDAWRSLLLILAASVTIFFGVRKRLKHKYVYIIFIALFLIDLYPVGRRFLNSDNFKTQREANSYFAQRPVDKQIKQDTATFRVLDLTKNIFNDASVSYFHHSIGGYHGAKLQRYQDMIDRHLTQEIAHLIAGFGKIKTIEEAHNILREQPILNMLNTKYLIIDQQQVVANPYAFSNAWFVKEYKIAGTPNAEMNNLDVVDLRKTAVLDSATAHNANIAELHLDSLAFSEASIILTSYKANRLIYKVSSPVSQLTVFSEVYYPKGWKAYIDGNEVPIIRANYLLRALIIPQGVHEVVFEYKPESFFIGKIYAFAASVILLVALVVMVILGLRRTHKSTPIGKKTDNK